MKLTATRVESFLRRPDPEIRAVLFYGPDAGLVRERAAAIAHAICPDLRDPFRVAELSGATLAADPARLADETAQISLMGGRRVVRVREASDNLAPQFERLLAAMPGDALVVVECGDLPARSALRRVFEDAPRAAGIGCYPDTARELTGVVRETFAAHRITAGRDVIEFLIEYLGGDRLLTRAELEKLTLYAGEGGRIEIEDAQAVMADTAGLSMENAVLAAAEGNVAALDRALARVLAEGESPVSVIRALLRHLQRLHVLATKIAAGGSAEEAIRSARPPVFFKQQDSFRRQLSRWSETRLRAALDRAAEAEFRMKLTGAPAETLCRAAMFEIAAASRA